MLNRELLDEQLSELPLYFYTYLEPKTLDFSDRIRWICEHECPMYGKSWACPPGVGTVEKCRAHCLSFEHCLMIATVTEVMDIANITETLSTRGDHESVTNQVRDLMREQGIDPYILSTEACSECERCAILDNEPCRMPERMHPCVESHGINLLTLIDEYGLAFQYGENVVTWFSLLLW